MSREKFASPKVNCFCSVNNAFVMFVTYRTLTIISRQSVAAEAGFHFCVSINTALYKNMERRNAGTPERRNAGILKPGTQNY